MATVSCLNSTPTPRIVRFWRAGLALGLMVGLAGCETMGGVTAGSSPVETEDRQVASTDIASLSAVVQKNPNDAEAWNMRGSAYARSSQYDLAVKDFNQALTLQPNFAQALANRALVYRKMNRQDLAMADYSQAIASNPQYAPAYVGRGNIYRAQGQTDQAMADYNKAIGEYHRQTGTALRVHNVVLN